MDSKTPIELHRADRDAVQTPKIVREVAWAGVWFVLLVAARVLSVPLGYKLGLDESQLSLVVKPVTFVSNLALIAAGFVAFIKFIFPMTLGRDMGTRFNQAWQSLDDPFKIIMVYVAIGAPLLLSLALLIGMN